MYTIGTTEYDNFQSSLQPVIYVNLHKNSKGETIARLYNPSMQSEQFSIAIGDVSLSGSMSMAEVATVVFKDGKMTLVHDKMPV